MFEHRSTAALWQAFSNNRPLHGGGRSKSSSPTGLEPRSPPSTHGYPTPATSRVRFHVVRWFTAGLTAQPRDIQRRPHGTQPAFDPDVFRARFALLRRGDQLTEAPTAHIRKLLVDHPRLQVAWDALQELYGPYFLAEDYDGALAALRRFADLYATGELPEFSKVVDTVIAWGDEILAWHRCGRPSNGRLEGANNLHPSPTKSRPRLHQRTKLRRPGTPPNMAHTPTTAPLQSHKTTRRAIRSDIEAPPGSAVLLFTDSSRASTHFQGPQTHPAPTFPRSLKRFRLGFPALRDGWPTRRLPGSRGGWLSDPARCWRRRPPGLPGG